MAILPTIEELNLPDDVDFSALPEKEQAEYDYLAGKVDELIKRMTPELYEKIMVASGNYYDADEEMYFDDFADTLFMAYIESGYDTPEEYFVELIEI